MNTVYWQWIGFIVFSVLFWLVIVPNVRKDLKRRDSGHSKIKTTTVSDLLMLGSLSAAVWFFIALPIFPKIEGPVLRGVVGIFIECVIPSLFLISDIIKEPQSTN